MDVVIPCNMQRFPDAVRRETLEFTEGRLNLASVIRAAAEDDPVLAAPEPKESMLPWDSGSSRIIIPVILRLE